MPNTIEIKRSHVTDPPTSLVFGELAYTDLNGAPGKLFIGDNAGTVREIAGASYALLASPTFTGTPAGPTATAGTNTTQLATTAFVVASYAPLASPALTGTPTAPTATGGTNTTQIATTAFVTAAISAGTQITSWKHSARVSTTANVTGATYTASSTIGGGTITAYPNTNAAATDSVTLAVGDIVLITNGVSANAAANGPWVVVSGTTSLSLARPGDFNAASQHLVASVWEVGNEGTVNTKNASWVISNAAGYIVDSASAANLTFVRTSGAGQLTAGTGITITGDSIAVAATYAGGTSIATVGTITAGTWNGTTIDVAHGGSGATTLTGILKGNGTGAFTAASAGTDYLSPSSTIDGGTF